MDKRIDLLTSHITADMADLRATDPSKLTPVVCLVLFMVINLAETILWLLAKHNVDTNLHANAKMASTSERMLKEANGD